MAENVVRYQVGSENPTPEPTAEQRQAMHDQARQPGRLKFQIGSDEGVTIEYPQETPKAAPAERAGDWLNNLTDGGGTRVDLFNTDLSDSAIMVPLPGGDQMTLASAKAAGLIRRNARGEYVAAWAQNVRPEEQGRQQEQSHQQPQEQQRETLQPGDSVSVPVNVAENMRHLEATIGEAGVASLFVQLAEGQDIPASRFEQIASAFGEGVEPGHVRGIIERDMATYIGAANDAIALENVPNSRATAFREWAKSAHQGDFREAVWAIRHGDARPLRTLARTFVSQHALGMSDQDFQGRSLRVKDGTTLRKAENSAWVLDIPGEGYVPLTAAIRRGLAVLED